MKKIIIVLLSFFILSACTSVPVPIETAPLPEKYQELGESSHKSFSFLLLGVIPITHRSMTYRAYHGAINKKGGDALINPKVSQSYYWCYVGGELFATTVSGTVIKDLSK